MASTDPDRELRSMAAGTTTVAQFAAWCRAQAEEIAASFDARYGDDHVTRRVAMAWDLDVTPVDLSVLAVTTPSSDAPAGTPIVDQPGDRRVPTPWDPAGRAVADAPDGSPSSLVKAAEVAARRGNLAEAAPWYHEAGDLLVADGMLADAGFAFAEAARCAQVLEDHEGAHAAFARAVDLLRAGGEPALVAPVVRAWTASACAVGDGEAALDRLAQVTAGLETDSATGGERGEVTCGERSEVTCGERSEVTGPVARARKREVAAVADVRARALATLGRWDEAVTTGSEAADALDELGAWDAAGQASWLVGRLLAQAGQVDAAAGRYRTAADQLGRAHDREQQVKVLDGLVRLLRDAGRDDDADEVVTRLIG